ncbi:L-threonine O-3-phosphate decarboxylase [Synechococcus sp. PCC 7502]|uniref:threonine-phosphate decarboxylase CobD n=1 Tax=Synechococcus sp. PCC 7502 TaxID=1173263 RepID=UPI00029FBB84|nr:threonine-phosphate decarboxylase CobD [Synechococcus sp. PCC 7502]AFY75182.1 L-threonine O-3-phosphate decarboxylase [Synechococcus sp. PCC 7502]
MQPNHGGNLRWAANIAGTSEANILDFSASINPLGTPDSAIAAIHSHLTSLKHYPDPEYIALRQALAEFHQISSGCILAGNGVSELLTWAGRDLGQFVATVLFTPAFSDYYRAFKTFGVEIEDYALGIDDDRELKFFLPELPKTGSRLQKGILINNPHNPTGYLFTRKALIPYLDEFGLVVIDEAFMDFLPLWQQQSLIDLVPKYSNLVILRSLTKFYGLPGLRLGYAIAHPDRVNQWQQWRDPWSVNSLAVAAGIAIVKDIEFQQKTWDWLSSARPQLWQGLNHLEGIYPIMGAANYLLVRTEASGAWLQQQLLQSDRILIRDCLSFTELGDHYIRVAVRLEAENNRLIKGLAKIMN